MARKQRGDIEEIVHQGNIEDAIKILQGDDMDDFVLLFTTKKGFIDFQGSTGTLKALGMIDMVKEMIHDKMFEAAEEETDG